MIKELKELIMLVNENFKKPKRFVLSRNAFEKLVKENKDTLFLGNNYDLELKEIFGVPVEGREDIEGFYLEYEPNYFVCEVCGMELEGWIYYEKNGFRICKFCYDGLELKGDDDNE